MAFCQAQDIDGGEQSDVGAVELAYLALEEKTLRTGSELHSFGDPVVPQAGPRVQGYVGNISEGTLHEWMKVPFHGCSVSPVGQVGPM